MDVLMVVRDTDALREGSAMRASILEQAGLVNRLFVIVLNRHSDPYGIQRVSDSVWFMPTNSWAWWLAPWDAMSVARRELFFQGHLQADLVAATDPCESGFAGLLLSRRYNKPLHVRIDRNIFSRSLRFLSLPSMIRAFAARFVVRASSRILAASENIKASLALIGTNVADRTLVLLPFIDMELLMKEPVRVDLHAKYPHFRFIIFMTGPLVPAQNIDLGISILAAVLGKYAHVGLVIVGEGRLKRHLRAFARRLGVLERVIIEPPNENVLSYYKTANVFLVTTMYTDDENTIARASACGCPIVSTRIGIAPSIISHGDSGFLCDPEDKACFVASIVKLVYDPNIRARVRINSPLYLDKSVGGNKEQYLRLLREEWERALQGEA